MSLTLYISFNPDLMSGERGWQALRLLWLGGALFIQSLGSPRAGNRAEEMQPGEGADGGRDIDYCLDLSFGARY